MREEGRESGAASTSVVIATVVVVLLVGLLGYGYADVTGRVPGPLTTAPPPQPYPTVPAAPGLNNPSPVAPAAQALATDAPEPSKQGLTTTLTPLLAQPALGGQVSGTIRDAATGTVLFESAASTPREPASVAKVLTSAAALSVLGPDSTVPTSVVSSPGAQQITLKAGGDVLLGAGNSDPTAVVGRAGLATLAEAAAKKLSAEGRTTVTVLLDDSVLGGLGWGNAMGPGWSNADITNGFVAPVTGLAVDAGRTGTQPYAPRVADPGLDAAQQFSAALGKHGLVVQGAATRKQAPADAEPIATVESAPISEVVGYTMEHSDNNAAEALARLVAIKAGEKPDFATGGQAVLKAVAALGVDVSGCVLADGSGLSDGSKLTTTALAATLTLAGGDHPSLRPLLQALPVAGLTGTLAPRYTAEDGTSAGVGIVRAKTGTLSSVGALAGELVTRDGRRLTYAFIANNTTGIGPARVALDKVAVALVECGCR